MAEILETTMMVCFGFSWPMSVYKNIKAHTAKSMSLQFILLIITGYVAGIIAKLYTHRINYVLVVYLINLVMVSINLVVYFINRRYDAALDSAAEAEAAAEKSVIAPKMAPAILPVELSQETLGRFHEMNRISRTGGAVFFGSDTFSHIPMCELAMDSGCEIPVYNRSIEGLSIQDVQGVLDACVLDLNPRMVFVNIGEADLSNGELDCDDFINRYEWLLYTLHSKCHGAIHIVSILSDSPVATELNSRLKKLAEDSGCTYIDALHAMRDEHSASRIFNCMKAHMHTHTIGLEEAMLIH